MGRNKRVITFERNKSLELIRRVQGNETHLLRYDCYVEA